MERRGTLSTDQLKDRLLAELPSLVHLYAPPASGSYTKGGLYFTLNPGRADRTVGSFCITMDGPKQGRWHDYATGEKGDVIDLIGLSLGITDTVAKFREARAFLGLDTEDPATRRAREDQAARIRAEREAKAAADVGRADQMRKWAEGCWLSGQERIAGTPVELYLRARGIDLAALGHQPGAIRYHPECRYYYTEDVVNAETGEITTQRRHRPLPAMVTAIGRGDKIIDCHRTYLSIGTSGAWEKANIEDAKKVFTDYTGGSIRLSRGIGPKGGRGAGLAHCPPGTRVFITEGIENGLSLMMLRHLAGQPPVYVLAAGSIWNMAHVELPSGVAQVVLAADNDSHPQAREALERAVVAHADKGRSVAVWRSDFAGEDLNDALRRVLAAPDMAEGAA